MTRVAPWSVVSHTRIVIMRINVQKKVEAEPLEMKKLEAELYTGNVQCLIVCPPSV